LAKQKPAKTIPQTPDALLQHVAALPHQRATYKQLVKELGSRGLRREELDTLLDRLLDKGALIEIKRDQYVAAGASREFATGTLRVHRDGYGFIVPDKPIPGLQGDIFVGHEETAKAMHGDRVMVHMAHIDRDGRTSGEILKVMRRAHATIVGEFQIRRNGNFVKPHDERLQQWILIPDGLELPPAAANEDRLGIQPKVIKSAEDLEGQIVNVEILEFPEDGQGAVGRVVEVLGHPDDFGVDVEVIIRKHHLPHHFPAPVIEQAKAISKEISAAEIARRRDFRQFDIVTIDGETARDFDDAVWVDRLPNGHWSLQVHIADVSHYIRPGTPIDLEAALRGTSVYFPDRAVPMLPLELSTDVCSLKPNEDRLVLSAIIEFDARGDAVSQDFCSGIIHSRERMTYTKVHQLLEGDPAETAELRQRYQPLLPRFALMKELALVLNKRRVLRGSIDFDLPEPLIEFDEFGEMTGVTRSPRNIAHRLIEEFMLAANEAVASHLQAAGVPTPYRIHEVPDAKKVAEFEEIASRFGLSLTKGGVPMKRFAMTQKTRDGRKLRKDTHLADTNFQISSKAYQQLVAKIEGKPEERILSYLMLRSLKQARYSPHNVGHFALAAPMYAHFTSPIRRYPDLILHRALRAHLETPGTLAYTTPQLEEITEDCSFSERRAAEAERELVEWKKAKFMTEHVGDEFAGLITSTTRFGFFVELETYFVEGLVSLDTMRGDRWMYQENTRKIVGERTRRTFSIGDKIRVRLDRVDAAEGRLHFSLAAKQ
jgi:ribonuclease R